jgi:hypothetical protein
LIIPKKKSLLDKITKEFQNNWKEDYFSISSFISNDNKIREEMLKAVNDYKSGNIDLYNYEIDKLNDNLFHIKSDRENINRCEKQIQDPVTLEKRKLFINDIIDKFQKKKKEYFDKGIKNGVNNMYYEILLFIIENYNNGSYNFPQLPLHIIQETSEYVNK